MAANLQIMTRELLLPAETKKAKLPEDPNFRLLDHIRVVKSVGGENGSPMETTVEFIGTGDFDAQWFERQKFEVDAGREEEPILYTPLFNEITSAALPRYVTTYQTKAGGVVFDEIKEGGEVKFVQITSANYPVEIKHYAVGLEYTKDLVMYNELWNLPIIERAVGRGYNALQNHVHLYPFIAQAYGAANQTAASTLGSTVVEKTSNTLENAIAHARVDTTNPRKGPYYVLCSSSNLFTIEKALTRVPQQGFETQSPSAISMIRGIIAYDDTTIVRGKKSTTYTGVTANKCYLISTAFKAQDHQSYIKQTLQGQQGDGDLTRFILEQVVWDAYFGVYVNPLASTEEVTLPTS